VGSAGGTAGAGGAVGAGGAGGGLGMGGMGGSIVLLLPVERGGGMGSDLKSGFSVAMARISWSNNLEMVDQIA
jgi:hypothetical protein